MAFTLGPSDQMPNAITRVLQRSLIDGIPAGVWLNDSSVDPVRKACLLNILAMLAVTPSTTLGPSLLLQVYSVFSVKTDRIAVICTTATRRHLDDMVAHPDLPVYADYAPPVAVHREMVAALTADAPCGLGACREAFARATLRSYRCEGSPSLQVVIADSPHDYTIADVDLDLFPAKQDVVSILGHQVIELLPNLWRRLRGKPTRVTDHLALRARLAKGPAAPYLGYTLDA